MSGIDDLGELFQNWHMDMDGVQFQQQQLPPYQQVAQAPQAPPAPPAPPVLAPEPRRPRDKLPPLATFDGDRSRYLLWRSGMMAKFTVDGPAMGSDYVRVATLFAALTGEAQRLAGPAVSRIMESGNPSLEAAVGALDRQFRRFDESRNALHQWGQLVQGKASFESFLSEWERLLALANGDQLTDEMKMFVLTRAVDPKIRSATLSSAPQTLAELVQLYHSTALNIEHEKDLSTCSLPYLASSLAQRRTYPQASHPDAMDIDPVGFPAASRDRGGRRRPANTFSRPAMRADPNSMASATDDELRGRRAKWVSRDEIQQRRDQGVCVRCTRRNCRAARCPLLPARNPNQQASSAHVGYVAPSRDDVLEPEEPSGNA